MLVKIKGTNQKVMFPDDMSREQIQEVLRRKFYQQKPDEQRYQEMLTPAPSYADSYEPSLAEKTAQGISNALYNTGLISNRYGANQIGENISTGLGFIPGIGDAQAGDEFGRALRKGDLLGSAMAGAAAIPVVGDAAKAGLRAFKPTRYTDLIELKPQQLVERARKANPESVVNGVYRKQSNRFYTDILPDGTVQMRKNDGTLVAEKPPSENVDLLRNEVVEQENKSPQMQEAIRQQELEARSEPEIAPSGYRMQHKAPTTEDNPQGFNLEEVFGSDIYSPDALRLFGTGAKYDQKAINVIQKMKGNPDKKITVYRAVPDNINDINHGDWVTTTKEYAQDHAEGMDGAKIISKEVKASDIASEGNSIHEFGYSPKQSFSSINEIKSAWKDKGISSFVAERSNAIVLDKIVVPKDMRGTGIGTESMQQLIDYADSVGKRIELTPSSDFGGNKKRLIDFYKRLGFVENKGKNKDYEVSEAMYRPVGN